MMNLLTELAGLLGLEIVWRTTLLGKLSFRR